MNILKFICLFVAILMTGVNVNFLYKKITIPFGNFFWWALGAAGFIFLQFIIN